MHHLLTSLRATAIFLLTRATARRAAPLPHRRPSTLAIAFALCAMWSCESQASSDWPTRPVTIIVPFVAGGNTDMMARLAAERLSAKFGQPFVIENRGGAGGVNGAGAGGTLGAGRLHVPVRSRFAAGAGAAAAESQLR